LYKLATSLAESFRAAIMLIVVAGKTLVDHGFPTAGISHEAMTEAGAHRLISQKLPVSSTCSTLEFGG
jgi:hypothetical protein